MTPHYADDWLTVYEGDAATVLSGLDASSVHCVVTSPPYWGLRDYGNDGQLGLEATPEEYVANLVSVFKQVRRVLRDDGTLWLNLGDSYANDGKWGGSTGGKHTEALHRKKKITVEDVYQQRGLGRERNHTGLKPKDLVGIPWRVAFALQADGWYLRSDIIWAKPNPMPESVTDRPTKAHEYLFLLSKSPRYYFDQEAVREDNASLTLAGSEHLRKDWHERPGNGEWPSGTGGRMGSVVSGRNLRSVWTIATRPYPGAHFAVFPPELPERCIKAGSSERGVCPECGSPWERAATGWTATCGHWTHQQPGCGWCAIGEPCPKLAMLESGPVPATILDPFAGSGTVGLVANRLSRRAVLIDLNPAYLEQQMQRNAQVPVGL